MSSYCMTFASGFALSTLRIIPIFHIDSSYRVGHKTMMIMHLNHLVLSVIAIEPSFICFSYGDQNKYIELTHSYPNPKIKKTPVPSTFTWSYVLILLPVCICGKAHTVSPLLHWEFLHIFLTILFFYQYKL